MPPEQHRALREEEELSRRRQQFQRDKREMERYVRRCWTPTITMLLTLTAAS